MVAVSNLALLVVTGIVAQVLVESRRVPQPVVQQCMEQCRDDMRSGREGFTDADRPSRTMTPEALEDLRRRAIECVQQCINDIPREQTSRHYQLRNELESDGENHFEDRWEELNVSTQDMESPDCQEDGFVFTNESASSPEIIVSLLRRCMASPNGGMLYQIVEKHEDTCHGIKYCGPESDPESFIDIVVDLDPQCEFTQGSTLRERLQLAAGQTNTDISQYLSSRMPLGIIQCSTFKERMQLAASRKNTDFTQGSTLRERLQLAAGRTNTRVPSSELPRRSELCNDSSHVCNHSSRFLVHRETPSLLTCTRRPICGTDTEETDSHHYVYYRKIDLDAL